VNTEFDLESYRELNQARGAWLQRVLSEFPARAQLRTAADIGCGGGYFTGLLLDAGLTVAGYDLREENLSVCRQHYPDAVFRSVNLDVPFSLAEGYDLVLLFGILYHLQSPQQTLQRLARYVGQVAMVSTRTAPGHDMAGYYYYEKVGEAHNTARVTCVPTLPALVSLFQLAGFEYIYRPDEQPDHPQWAENAPGQRHSLVVSRLPIDRVAWRQLSPAPFLKKW
jgi:2-polyprenyl-3-methyl-5-hydroxy-6-metoxy-1,4-benzoquinol methylase